MEKKQGLRSIFTIIVLYIFTLVFLKINIGFKQNGLFFYSHFADILLVALQLVWVFFIAKLFWQVIKRSSKILKTIGFLLLPFCLLYLVCMYNSISRSILLSSKQTDPSRFIKNETLVAELTKLSQELIRRKNIIWISSKIEKGDYVEFGIVYDDGVYLFSSKDISADLDFDKPVSVVNVKDIDPWPVPKFSDYKKTQKILSVKDYLFCKQASGLLRKNGFDSLELVSEDGIVKFAVGYTLGWDICNYWYYYFCPNSVFPEKYTKEVKNITKLSENWFFAKYKCK